jgi:two-component sensor histidine kinase
MLRIGLTIKSILLNFVFALTISDATAQQPKTQSPKHALSGLLIKLISLSTAFVSTIPGVAAQQGPKELLLAIQKSKPDTNRVRLQLKLGSYYHIKPLSKPVKPREFERNRDSAISLFNQALQLSNNLRETDWKYSALEMIAECEGEIKPGLSKEILLQTVAYYHQKGNLSKEARAWERLASAYFKNDKFNDNLPQKIRYYQHARSLFLQNHEPIKATAILTEIAAHRIIIKQFDLAEKDLQQSLTEYKAAGYRKLQYTYMTLVDLEYAKGNYYRAIAYCIQGIKNTVIGENTQYTSYFYWNAARCNYSVKKYQEALDWLRKAIDIDSNYPDYKYFQVEPLLALNRTEEARETLNNIAKEKFPHTSWDTLNLYKGLALYYAKKNNTDAAIRYYLKSLEMAGKVFGDGGYSWYLIIYNGIAEVYLKANLPEKAIKYINDAALTFTKAKTVPDPVRLVNFYENSYKYNVETGYYRAAFKNAKTPLDRGLLVDFYNNLYKYHVAIADYRTAILDLQRRVDLQDSLSTVNKDNKLAELVIQYETAQKEQSIKNLHNQAAAQQARLQTANLQRNITIGGVAIMIVISSFFYKYYKQKKSANEIITHKNNLLQRLLTEKDWLFKEVHHRVKNNLHTVISLLEAQASYLENDALMAIENSQHRIYAMSLIHQKLYQSEDIKNIDMAQYIPELLQYLRDSFATSHIYFNVLVDPIQLNAAQAIPLGLIINEAVTNSIKYAFPDGRRGEIAVSFTDINAKYKLELADNGIGIPEGRANVKNNSLGLELMKGLAKEIGGNIIFENANGVKITIIFETGLLHYSNRLQDDHLAQA